MKNFQIASLAALSMIFAQAASASTFVRKYECASVNAGPDYGYMLTINSVSGPLHTTPHMTAVVQEESIAGPQLVGQYEVAVVPFDGRMGAPLEIKGTDFDLSIFVDGAPRPDGKHVSHLTIEAKGARIAEEMLCTIL